jgi:hypothetical protein
MDGFYLHCSSRVPVRVYRGKAGVVEEEKEL